MFRSLFKFNSPRTRRRRVNFGEYVIAGTVGIVTGVYIFKEPLEKASAEVVKERRLKEAESGSVNDDGRKGK